MRAVASRDKNFRSCGYSLVELLIAVAILSVSGLAFAWAFSQLAKNNTRLSLTSAVTSIEASLSSELLDEANYPTAVRRELKDGLLPPPSLKFQLTGETMGSNFSVALLPGRPVGLTSQLQVCNAFPSSDCPIQLLLAIAKSGSGFAYAYRIQAQHPSVALNYTGAGAGLAASSSNFVPADYTVAIPLEYYLETMLLECPANSLAVKGIDTATGNVICISQPTVACPDKRLPKRIEYVQASNSIELTCGSTIQTAACPPDYFLNSIDTRTLDGGIKTGTCVYHKASAISGPSLGPSRRIAGQVCPAGYRSQSSCFIVNASSASGTNPNWCYVWDYNCGSASGSYQSSVGTWHRTIPKDLCTSQGPRIFPANSGNAVLTENSPPGYADCSLHLRQQDWGATWAGQVQLNIRCVLDTAAIPETANVF